MADIDKIKEYFRNADDETIKEIRDLEKRIKSNQLFLNLRDHDAMKMILDSLISRVAKIDNFLKTQSAESLSSEQSRITRAYQEAYRDFSNWFIDLFVIAEKRTEIANKTVEKFESKME